MDLYLSPFNSLHEEILTLKDNEKCDLIHRKKKQSYACVARFMLNAGALNFGAL
jgi:hypothetical protein